jgi:hypothetical protein
VDLYRQSFAVLKEPKVQTVKFVAVYANAQALRQSISGLLRYVCSLNPEHVVADDAAPQDKAFDPITSGGTKLGVGFIC